MTTRTAPAMTGELFSSVTDATEFFRAGALGYSPGQRGDCMDGVRLVSDRWDAEPVVIEEMSSSLFDDTTMFPPRTCTLDSALVMRDLPVRWASGGQLAPQLASGRRPARSGQTQVCLWR